MFFSADLVDFAKRILEKSAAKNIKLAFAESCTGGLLSALFTEIAGSSKVVDRGFVVYSNQAKIDLLEVNELTLKKFGAVSFETASEMAAGALKNSNANIAISITGVAGEEEKSGLVFMAVATQGQAILKRKYQFSGTRFEIRKASVIAALSLIEQLI